MDCIEHELIASTDLVEMLIFIPPRVPCMVLHEVSTGVYRKFAAMELY